MTLPRPQRPGSITSAISDALDAAGRREVEAGLDVSASVLSRWSDPDEENGRRAPAVALDRMARMFPGAARVFARHFAGLAGGVFLEVGGEGEDGLRLLAADAVKEVAEAAHAVAEGLSARSADPRRLTDAELASARREAAEALAAVARLDAALAAELRARVGAG